MSNSSSVLVKMSIGAKDELLSTSLTAVSPVVTIRSDLDRMCFRTMRSSGVVAKSLSASKMLGEIT